MKHSSPNCPQEDQNNSETFLKTLRSIINVLYNDTKKRPLLNRLKWIDNVQFVQFAYQEDQDQKQDKMHLNQIVCCECDCSIRNALLLLFHLRLAHEAQNFNILICQDAQMLLITKQLKGNKKETYQKQINNYLIYSHCNIRQKMQILLLDILTKLNKRQKVPPKRAFYHCLKNFKEISKDSSDSDQEDGTLMIHSLQQRKMKQLEDISKSEMRFFILWNQFVHDIKKQLNGEIGIEKKIVDRMGQFFAIKEIGQMKYHLLTHLNILLSYGILNRDQFIRKVQQFHEVQRETSITK